MDEIMVQAFRMVLDRLESEIRANAVSHESYQNLLAECDRLRTARQQADPTSTIALMKFIADGKKIDAIKVFRNITGSYLKEAKDIIESVMDRERVQR